MSETISQQCPPPGQRVEGVAGATTLDLSTAMELLPKNIEHQMVPDTIPPDHVTEALFLYIMAAVGCFFNAVVFISIIAVKSLRRTSSSAFVLHGSVLDLVRCVYCVPFATSILRDAAPESCSTLGSSYILIVTASGFNIVAMVCGEAFSFSEQHLPSPPLTDESGDTVQQPAPRPAQPAPGGSICCVVFGIAMVYVGSVIIHLGPTIIGGDFNYNDHIGNCIFVYGTVKSYIVHTMWIAIMTLTIASALYYLIFFYRHLQENATYRAVALLLAVSTGGGNGSVDERKLRQLIRHSLSRSLVLILITALFVVCWYPLYLLTLFDPSFRQPTKVYKLLTFIAWSNSSLNPVVLLLFDSRMSVFRRLFCSSRRYEVPHLALPPRGAPPPLPSRSSSFKASEFQALSAAASAPETVYDRVGCRLCREGIAASGRGRTGPEGVWMRNGDRAAVDDLSVCELHCPGLGHTRQ